RLDQRSAHARVVAPDVEHPEAAEHVEILVAALVPEVGAICARPLAVEADLLQDARELRVDRAAPEVDVAPLACREQLRELELRHAADSSPAVAGSALLRRPLSACCGVGGHRRADELLEGRLVDLLAFAEIDRTPCLSFQAGVEELLRVLDRGSAKEGELHDLLVRLARADAAVMRPYRGASGFRLLPFPLLLDVGVGLVDQLPDLCEGLSSPIPQLFDPLADVRRSGLAVWTICRRHAAGAY